MLLRGVILEGTLTKEHIKKATELLNNQPRKKDFIIPFGQDLLKYGIHDAFINSAGELTIVANDPPTTSTSSH
jgi:hypothetical protein